MRRLHYKRYVGFFCLFFISNCGVINLGPEQSEDTISVKDSNKPSTANNPMIDDGKPKENGVATFKEVKTILDKQCGACHSDKSTFITPATYSNLIDKKYVVPGASSESYLFQKGTGKTPTHNDQPGFAPLNTIEGDADRVKSWIDAGAINN